MAFLLNKWIGGWIYGLMLFFVGKLSGATGSTGCGANEGSHDFLCSPSAETTVWLCSTSLFGRVIQRFSAGLGGWWLRVHGCFILSLFGLEDSS